MARKIVISLSLTGMRCQNNKGQHSIPLYEGKGRWSDCSSHKGISLLSVPGKIYGRVQNWRMMKITNIGTKQAGFKKGRGCVEQIFVLQIIVEKYLEKGRKLYAVFMDLEKAYDKN